MNIQDDDKISPSLIEHRCEEIFNNGQLENKYNYIRYEFETRHHTYWARSYLNETDEVSIFGPFLKADPTEIDDSAKIDESILSYLRRRYKIICQLTDEGYVNI